MSVSEEQVKMEEGCLSAPGDYLESVAAFHTISYQNADQEIVMEEFDGLWGRVTLHEYDHMLGQNFLMRVSKLQLDRAIKKVKKQQAKIKKKEKRSKLYKYMARVWLIWKYSVGSFSDEKTVNTMTS